MTHEPAGWVPDPAVVTVVWLEATVRQLMPPCLASKLLEAPKKEKIGIFCHHFLPQKSATIGLLIQQELLLEIGVCMVEAARKKRIRARNWDVWGWLYLSADGVRLTKIGILS